MLKYYSVVKMNELHLHELTWKRTNYILLNESGKMQSCLYNMISFMVKSIYLHICPDIREMSWKKVLNEVFKLSKLIASGQESEIRRMSMVGEIKWDAFLTLYFSDLFESFTKENVLLRLLFKKKLVKFSSSLHSISILS